ncbi:MAG: hypothetical protein Q9199_006988 [Rusavskia elegans]
MARVYSIEFLLRLRPRAMQHPFRQPLNPPEATLIQKHAGFARFLKQHASPPHHRVTAGGRIVPAGPLSPPPFQLLPSINAVVSNPYSRSVAEKSNVPETSNKGSSNPKTPYGTPLAQQNVNANRPRPFDNPHLASGNVGTTQATQTQAPLINQFGTNLGPLPPGATPIGFLLDGSPLVYFDGVSYQSYWDGTSTILKPLQLSVPHMGYNAPAYSQMALGPQFYGSHGSIATGYAQDAFSSLQFTDGINDAREQTQQIDTASSQNLAFLHSQLSSELTSLDRYVALHLHEFPPAENARCTAMRRQLVEQLDNLRVSKGSTDPLKPTNGKMYGSYAAAAPWAATNVSTEPTHLSYGVSANINSRAVHPTTPVASGVAASQGYSSGVNGRSVPPVKSRKCLSPDAPPFVPGATAPLTDRAHVSQRIKPSTVQKLERREQHGYSDDCKDHTTDESMLQKAQVGSGKLSMDLSCSNDTESAVPHVSMSEIEYASTPGFNPPGAPKVYCTTASEFQEVIRRVRQQAQMYGCKGGQSKDPAYDAEQDVRWAMADGEPIPLPRSPADHLTQPRPWNWDDSTFNCRRQISISPLWAKNTVAHGVSQQSMDSTGHTNRSRADSWVTNSQKASDYRLALYGAESHKSRDSHTERSHPSSRKDNQEMLYRQCGKTSRPNQQTSSDGVKASKLRDAEHDALSFDSQGIPYSEVYDAGTLYGARSKPKAKVNLPPAHGHPASSEATEEHRSEDLRAVQFVKVPSDETSHGFLRGLLKSPRYSAARAHKSEPVDQTPYYMNVEARSHQERAQRLANKENVQSDDYDNSTSTYGKGLSRKIKESSMLQQSAVQEMLAHKARSSLAASSYYAVGSHSNHL